jgi:PPP family 3-phenylpropionic acid transporter
VALPYVPLWLAWAGLDGRAIGLVVGLQPALRWGSAVVLAGVADRRRIRHPLLVACALAGACCCLPLPFVHGVAPLAAVFAAIAVLHGPLVPLVDAVVLDHLHRLGGDYGRLRVAGSIAFVVGALAAGGAVAWTSPGAIPWLLVGAQAGLVPALLRLPRAQRGHAHEARAAWRLATPPLRTFLAAAFLLQASCGAWNGFFALHVQALGLSDALPGLAFGLAVVAESALFVWGRRFLERWAPPTLLRCTIWVTVVRWVLAAVVTSAPLVVAVQLLHAATFSVFHLAAQRILVQLVPAASRTSGQGLYGFVAFGVGATAGIWLAGALVDRVGTAALFGVEALVALAALWPARAFAARTTTVAWQEAA